MGKIKRYLKDVGSGWSYVGNVAGQLAKRFYYDTKGMMSDASYRNVKLGNQMINGTINGVKNISKSITKK